MSSCHPDAISISGRMCRKLLLFLIPTPSLMGMMAVFKISKIKLHVVHSTYCTSVFNEVPPELLFHGGMDSTRCFKPLGGLVDVEFIMMHSRSYQHIPHHPKGGLLARDTTSARADGRKAEVTAALLKRVSKGRARVKWHLYLAACIHMDK